MADLKHRAEVLQEVERLGIFSAIDAAESLVRRVKLEATGGAKSSNGAKRLGDSAPEHDAVARWGKDYAATEEGKRVSALITVRLRAMLPTLVRSMAQSTASFVHERIAEATAPLIARIGELERKKGIAPLAARVAELEARGWVGIWDAERSYCPKQQCTYGGNLWHCKKACTNVRPGTSDDWQLMQQNKSRR